MRWSVISRAVRAPKFDNRESIRTAAVLRPCVWAIVVASVLYMVLVFPRTGTPYFDAISLASSLAICALVLRLIHSGRVVIASTIFVATVGALAGGGSLWARQFDHSAEYVLVTMIAGTLLGGRGAGVLAATLFTVELVGVRFLDSTPANVGGLGLLAIELLCTTAFMSIAQRSVRAAFAEADDYADALEAKAVDLESASARLRQEIEQHRTTKEALVVARDQALEASGFKSRFLANMSHEIRTPMSAICGLTELLRSSDLDQQSAEYVQMIHTSANSLLVIINDILDISRVESGRLVLESRPVDIRACVATAAALVSTQASGKGLDLEEYVQPDVPRSILGDATRLQQVLLNLLGNAIKFTSAGRITLRVDATPLQLTSDQGDGHDRVPPTASHWLRIQVEDTGIGIPAEFRDRLFDPFSQADASTTREYGGSGLGLAITRQLVDLMGGDIDVDSEVGRGSTFTIRLPVQAVAREQPDESRPGEDPTLPPPDQHIDPALAAATPLDILVAEDNPINRKLAVHLLARMGYTARAVENGDQVVRAWREPPCDVIFMDMQMPGIDGLEATRRIRAVADGGTGRPYIIGLTANALPDDRERCLAVGMNEHLAKPFTPAQLAAALARAAAALGRVPARSPRTDASDGAPDVG